jgi:hypothetical protein
MRRCFAALAILNATLNALAKLEATGDLRLPAIMVLDTTACYQPRKEREVGRA